MEGEDEGDKRDWRSAVDKKSGRTYFYNVKTRATTWDKPLCMASPREREEMIKKRRDTLAFFKAMEDNMMRRAHAPADGDSDSKSQQHAEQSLRGGRRHGGGEDYRGPPSPKFDDSIDAAVMALPKPRTIRTISTIDDILVADYKRSENRQSHADSTAGSGPSMAALRRVSADGAVDVEALALASSAARSGSAGSGGTDAKDGDRVAAGSVDEMSASRAHLTALAAEGVQQQNGNTNGAAFPPRPPLKHRNSTGTIFVGHTMTTPDRDATIKVVCSVVRAHMVQAVREHAQEDSKEYDVYIDTNESYGRSDDEAALWDESRIPKLKEIQKFFRDVFTRSQMESECIIMSLIYLERLIKMARGRLHVRYYNWRPIVFSTMVMASKVWDDLSMWNVDFSQVCPRFTLHRINELELALLDALNYSVRVPASEYAKYYFHCRSMMARLGFTDEDINSLDPLDMQGARKLELMSEEYEVKSNKDVPNAVRRRCVTLHEGADPEFIENLHTKGYEYSENRHQQASLEQVVHRDHRDADGTIATPHPQAVQRKVSTAAPSAAATHMTMRPIEEEGEG